MDDQRRSLPTHRDKLIQKPPKKFTAASREDVYTDPQGRAVRTLHAAWVGAGPNRRMLWTDIHATPREQLEKRFGYDVTIPKYRRDPKQLKIESDGDNHS